MFVFIVSERGRYCPFFVTFVANKNTMASVTPNVNLYFNLDSKQVFVKDSTVWPTINGTPLNVILDLKGLGTLYSPSNGVIFSVTTPLTPLIDIADGAETSSNYNLPLTSGEIVVGTYTLNYEAQGGYTQAALTAETISNQGYIEIEDAELAAFLLQAGDTVNISGSAIEDNDGDWTVVSAQANNNFSRIYLTRSGIALITDNSASASVTYTIERTYATTLTPAYSGCTKITPAINFESLPYNGEFGTAIVLDTTVYGNTTVSDKVISVLYPDGLYPAPTFNPIIGEDVNSVTLTQVATGTYTITLTGLITVAPTVGLGYTYQMSGIRVNGRPVNVFEREVVWNGDLCCLQECITTVFDRHNRFVLQGQESPYTAAIADLSLAINRYIIALQCGIKTDIDSTYTDIKNILASTDCPCGCSDSTNPVWISNSSQEGENLITNLQDQIDALDAAINGINASLVDVNAELETKLSEVFTNEMFSGNGTDGNPLQLDYFVSNGVLISPPIAGLDASDVYAALQDLQQNKADNTTVYVGVMQQVGTSAPVITDVVNTLGFTFTTSRNSQGRYDLTSTIPNIFPAGRTDVSINNAVEGRTTNAFRTSSSTIRVAVFLNGSAEDNAISDAFLTIRIYP